MLNSEKAIGECNEGTLEWVDIKKVFERDIPFTAKECLKHYLAAGKGDNKLYAGVATEKGISFVELMEF